MGKYVTLIFSMFVIAAPAAVNAAPLLSLPVGYSETLIYSEPSNITNQVYFNSLNESMAVDNNGNVIFTDSQQYIGRLTSDGTLESDFMFLAALDGAIMGVSFNQTHEILYVAIIESLPNPNEYVMVKVSGFPPKPQEASLIPLSIWVSLISGLIILIGVKRLKII